MGSTIIWRSTARLSDGREIVYYDESPGSGRASAADTRPATAAVSAAPPAEAGPGMRWDPLAGEWVLVNAARQERTFLPPADQCPLCPSAPGRATEIPAESYDVAVFENRFPALRGGIARDTGVFDADPRALASGQVPGPADPEFSALAARGSAPGRCEVVCFTDRHDGSFATLSPHRVRTVVEAWADRTAVLGALPEIRQVYCFENRGEQIGVTLHHPHGQVYGFPFTTPRTARMIERARGYARAHGGSLFDDLVTRETAAGDRVVARNEHWTAFVPEAARWPYEVRFFPFPRVPDLPALSAAQRDAFGEVYLAVLRGLDRIFGAPLPYIAAWHQAPAGRAAAAGDRALFGAHLQVFSVQRAPGKLKYLAGTESGMGVWINDVAPEDAARTIREAM